ncbi:MAG: tetratricopeptide repeat protein [Thermomicrobiales bacterium]
MVAAKKSAKTKRQLIQDALDASLLGRWEEAIKINETIIERFPREAEAMNRKGRALIELRRLTSAREAYQDALKADPANMISRRNLQRLETLYNRPGGEPKEGEVSEDTIPRANVFIEEIGKTWVDELANPADYGQLAEVAPGSLLQMRQEDGRLVIFSRDGVRLGEIADGTAGRIINLMDGGNRYEVYALGISGNSLRVILREVFKDPSQGSRLSFPRQASRTGQLMRERELLFQREEGDFVFGDDEDEEGVASDDREDTVAEDEDEEVEIDRVAEAYVEDSVNNTNDDDEENAM